MIQLDKQFKSILVTGGCGFIGSHTALRLLKQGYDVTVVDEMNDYYDVSIKEANLKLLQAYPQFKVIKGDICDRQLMAAALEGIDCVVHLAARAGVRASIENPDVYVHSNLLGSTVIFDLVRGSQVKHVVYASSSSVYGANKKVPFSETDPTLNTVSPYAATKLGVEALAAAYSHLSKIKFTGLRFFTVYGQRGRPDMAPFKFVDSVARGYTINQFGDGSSSRDYTFIDDIVSGIIGSMGRPLNDKLHDVYNLGNSNPHTLKEFIQTVEQVVGKKAMIKKLPMQPGDVDKTYADISKANRDFGYEPKVPLQEGLTRLYEWWCSKYLDEGYTSYYSD